MIDLLIIPKGERDYLKAIRKKNTSVIHEWNYGFIDNYFIDVHKHDFFIGEDQVIYSGRRYIIDRLNYYTHSDFCNQNDYLIVSYKVTSYLLKNRMNFDIEEFTKDRDFIDMVKWRTVLISKYFYAKEETGEYYKEYKQDAFNHPEEYINYRDTEIKLNIVRYLKKFFIQLIDALYVEEETKLPEIYESEKESFINKIQKDYELLVLKLYEKYCGRYFALDEDPIEEKELDDLNEKFLKKEGTTMQESPETTETISSIEPKVKDSTENNQIKPLNAKYKLSKKQFEVLFKGLVEFECIDAKNHNDLYNFMELNKNKNIVINKVKWNKTKALCAFFVDAFNKDILKLDTNDWVPFEVLFGYKRLGSAKNDYDKSGSAPIGNEEIKTLINKTLKK